MSPLPQGSRAASALTAATLTSLGGTSSRRGSGETAVTVDAETSIREIKVQSNGAGQVALTDVNTSTVCIKYYNNISNCFMLNNTHLLIPYWTKHNETLWKTSSIWNGGPVLIIETFLLLSQFRVYTDKTRLFWDGLFH